MDTELQAKPDAKSKAKSQKRKDKEDPPPDPPLTIDANERIAFGAATRGLLNNYKAQLYGLDDLPPADLGGCFNLVSTTSASAYASSSKCWSPRDKREEMQTTGMRYIIVKANDEPGVVSFLSYLPVIEPDPDSTPPFIPVLYIYEIHVDPTQQGRGIGAALMALAEAVAAALSMKKTMLTVFTTNIAAIRFYERLGYQLWDEEVIPRKKFGLRKGTKIVKPTYVILAKDVPV